jgi:transcriptional regulator with XRE-family HTH domain
MERLGHVVRVTYQQMQRYELGRNRVSAEMLWRISTALDVNFDYFFDGLQAAPASARAVHQDRPGKDLFELAAAFERIPSARARTAVIVLMRALARDQ